ncbi:MAG: hypothetical protein RLZZ200_2282 [Pseudomonadota bacterium]|jgi:PAS domain S-box-containing protein
MVERLIRGMSADSISGFSKLLDALPVAIVIVDSTGNVVTGNERAARLFGRNRSMLDGMPVENLMPERFRASHPAWRNRFARQPEPRAMGAGRPLWGLRADGTEFPLEVGLSPVETPEGHFVLATVADISEREQTRRLEQAVHALEHSNIELRRFAHVASHDLQTPMRSIASFLQLIQAEYGGRLDDKGRGWIDRVVSSVHHLQRLVRDLLDYSNLDSVTHSHAPVDTAQVVRDALLLLDSAIQESEAVVIVGSLPTVPGVRSQLLQLFQNVIGNALKYRGDRPPRVEVGARPVEGGWEFHVSDNGIGIVPRHRERIFEIFQRLHDQSKYPGTGIGLAVCRRIVEAHGGRIWVESESGVGSTFRFQLMGPRSEETWTI